MLYRNNTLYHSNNKTADDSLAFTIVDDMFRLIYWGLSIEEHATIAYCTKVTQ